LPKAFVTGLLQSLGDGLDGLETVPKTSHGLSVMAEIAVGKKPHVKMRDRSKRGAGELCSDLFFSRVRRNQVQTANCLLGPAEGEVE
jgi:hypothetical protein